MALLQVPSTKPEMQRKSALPRARWPVVRIARRTALSAFSTLETCASPPAVPPGLPSALPPPASPPPLLPSYTCDGGTIFLSAPGGSCDSTCPAGMVCDLDATMGLSADCVSGAVDNAGGTCSSTSGDNHPSAPRSRVWPDGQCDTMSSNATTCAATNMNSVRVCACKVVPLPLSPPAPPASPPAPPASPSYSYGFVESGASARLEHARLRSVHGALARAELRSSSRRGYV